MSGDQPTYLFVIIAVGIAVWTIVGLIKMVRQLRQRLAPLVAPGGKLRVIWTGLRSGSSITRTVESVPDPPGPMDVMKMRLRAAGVLDPAPTEPARPTGAADRIATLEALHAEGEITAEKLAALKASIAAEDD